MITKELIKIQYKVERVITRIYKVISQVTLHIETHSLSINIRLERLTLKVALRIIINLSYNSIIETRFTRKKRKLSSLKRLTNKLIDRTKTSIKELKQITLYVAFS